MTTLKQSLATIYDLPREFWVVIGATIINQMGTMALIFLVVYLTGEKHFSLPQASFAFVIYGLGMLISGLIGGMFIDKFGAVKIMIIALFCNGVVVLGFPFLHYYHTIILFCCIWGFVNGVFRPASQTFISFLTLAGTYKIVFSIYRLALNLGLSIGPAIGGYLATHSFFAIFIINGLTNILASTLLCIGLINSSWFKSKPKLEKIKIEFSLKWLKEDVALRLLAIGMIPVSMIFFQHMSTLPIFIHSYLHYSLVFYGLLFTLNTLLIVFCELPLNIATLGWSLRSSLILGSLLLTLGFSGYFFATQKWEIVLLTIIWTTGEMIFYPAASSYIAEIAPAENRGSYMAIYNMSLNVGLLLGPWLGGIIMHNYTRILWLICGAWGLLSVLMFTFTEPKKIIYQENKETL